MAFAPITKTDLASPFSEKGRISADKLPPQSLEAEESVLGSLLMDKNAVIRVADILRSEDFYKRAHQLVFTAILHLYEKSEPVDVLSLSNRLKETGDLENVGGTSYLANLVNSVPTASNVAHYAKIVRHKKILRDLLSASQDIARLGFEENQDIELVLDEAEKRIFSIAERSLKQDFMPIKLALEDAFERIDKLHRGGGALRGLATGFADLDNYLGGLQKSDLVVLAARPSLGKTSLALDIARHAAIREKAAVGIFSLEMSKEQLVDRLLASEAGVDLWRLRTGRLSMDGADSDFSRIQEAMGVLAETPIFIDDAASANIIQMRTMARRLQAEHSLGLIIVDYLQLMEGRNSNSENRVQEISEISRSLKNLARELDVPVLALSQLSRAVESRSPQIPKLSDLRESGSIEQDADVVLFIYREDREKPNTDRKNVAEIIISKHRNGPVGKIDLYFNADQVSFRSLAKNITE
ncbi:MAG: replicative DNA helicase [Parcubacteria group bacterium]|nr:replicative DNA helicase [Parcubacteria group bacterium]